jgi:hypothetical protein
VQEETVVLATLITIVIQPVVVEGGLQDMALSLAPMLPFLTLELFLEVLEVPAALALVAI